MDKMYRRGIAAVLVGCICLILCAGCSQGPAEAKSVSVLESIDVNVIIANEKDVYTAGKDFELDEYGRIIRFQNTYETVGFAYDEHGALVKATVEDDGEIEEESAWTYQNGMPVAERYTSKGRPKTSEIEVETDAGQKVVSMKGKNESVWKYQYDSRNRISSLDFYSRGEKDHTTKLTYDDEGNILVCSFLAAETGSEYLHVELKYGKTDAGSQKREQVSSFNTVFNFGEILECIL